MNFGKFKTPFCGPPFLESESQGVVTSLLTAIAKTMLISPRDLRRSAKCWQRRLR
jgi:hypothetical protein